VDIVHNAEYLLDIFTPDMFDVVLSTEMLEHVRDWRKVLNGIKSVLKPGGTVVLTTRSLGYPFHAAPHDYWRYEVDDMMRIFSDFSQLAVETDSQEPGVFVSAAKPKGDYSPRNLSDLDLYSMVYRCRTTAVPPGPVAWWMAKLLVWEGRIRQGGRAIVETLRGRPPGLRFQLSPANPYSMRSERKGPAR
jgi:SAM-dependent methyltransferase